MYVFPFTLMMCSCTLVTLPLIRSAPIDGLCSTDTRRIEANAQSTQCESKLISRGRGKKHLQSNDEHLDTLMSRVHRKMFFSLNQRKPFIPILDKNESRHETIASIESDATHPLTSSLHDRLASNMNVFINMICTPLAKVVKLSREPLDEQGTYAQIVHRNKSMIIVHVANKQPGNSDIYSTENVKFKTIVHDGKLHIEVNKIGLIEQNQSILSKEYQRSVYAVEIQGNLDRVNDKKIYALPSREPMSGFYIILPLVERETREMKKIHFYGKKIYLKPSHHVKEELVKSSIKRDPRLVEARTECRKKYKGKKELTVEEVICECDEVYSYYTKMYTECLLNVAKRLMKTAKRAGAEDVVNKLQFRTRICVRGSLAGKRKHICLRMELKSVIRSWNTYVKRKQQPSM